VSTQTGSVTLNATLRAAGAPVSGATVTFGYALSGDSTFTSAGSGSTASSGVATSPTITLAEPDQYVFLASYGGSTTLLLGASSVQVTYDLTGTTESTSLTETLTPTSAAPGATVTVAGALTSSGAGVSDEIVSVILDGATLDTPETTSSGTYSYAFPAPSTAGSHSVEVVFAGTASYGGSSQTMTFTVTSTVGGGGGGTKSNTPLIVGAAAAAIAVAGVAAYALG
jgi:hypothetical protein